MERGSGVDRDGGVVPKSVRPNPPLLVRRDSWRKPRGVVATIGAFGRKGKVGQVSAGLGRILRRKVLRWGRFRGVAGQRRLEIQGEANIHKIQKIT